MFERMQKINYETRVRDANMAEMTGIVDLVQGLNKSQKEKIDELMEQVAIKASLVDAEAARAKEFSDRLNDMHKRALKAEEEAKIQQTQSNQMRLALKAANDRRTATEETLNALLNDPVLAAPATLATTDNALRQANEQLSMQVKEKQLQLDMLTAMFLQKEQATEAKNKQLQA